MATVRTGRVCVVGGGPGGMLLARELARRGCEVVVVEQSGPDARHLRGESLSPDAVWLLDRLGVLADLEAAVPIQETTRYEVVEDGRLVLQADLRRLGFERGPVDVPQRVLLRVLADSAASYPGFSLLRRTSAVALLEEDGRVRGVRCSGPDGVGEVRAALVVGADGRFSTVRDLAGLGHREAPLDRDVLWFTLPSPPDWDRSVTHVRIAGGENALLMPAHPDLVRMGLSLPKGGMKGFRARGIGALHERVAALAPEIAGDVRAHVTDWSDVLLLDMFTTTVPRWWGPGVVLLGDAAHTMSPVMGQGINHALVDAAVLAPLVHRALAAPDPDRELDAAARRFQRLRAPSVRRARRLQMLQERAFRASGPAAVRVRQEFYRTVENRDWLKRRIWRSAYRAGPPTAEPTTAAAASGQRPGV